MSRRPKKKSINHALKHWNSEKKNVSEASPTEAIFFLAAWNLISVFIMRRPTKNVQEPMPKNAQEVIRSVLKPSDI